MKVYELSKKHNVTNKEMIEIIKKLKVVSKKSNLNTFSALTPNDIQKIEKHFTKDVPVDKKLEQEDVPTEVLIVKKANKELLNEEKEKTKETEKSSEESTNTKRESILPMKAPPADEKESIKSEFEAKTNISVSKEGERLTSSLASSKIDKPEQTKQVRAGKKIVKVVRKKINKDTVKEEERDESAEEQRDKKETAIKWTEKDIVKDVVKEGSSVSTKETKRQLPGRFNFEKKGNKKGDVVKTGLSTNRSDKDKPGVRVRTPHKDFIQVNRGRRYTKTKGLGKDNWDKFSKQQSRSQKKRTNEQMPTKPKPKVSASSIPNKIKIMETITVYAFAKKLNIKASEIIAKLLSMGVMVTINEVIDSDTASLVAAEYNCETEIISFYDETIIEKVEDKETELESRPPIITVMGHVDHGKTKLLDALRESDITASEHGGITQHIGAYQVFLHGKKIVFLDTPGHAAFTSMRARGAKLTDIVVLVVAATDGVMEQTIEAINHAKAAGVSIIVAINKIDAPGANIDRVKQQLSDIELVAEEWGGQTMVVAISALKKEGLDTLLDSILVEAETLDLKANPNRLAKGSIIESQIDKGRGAVATVLIENGTLRIGDCFISGVYYGKVRALFSDRGKSLELANPGTPVEVLGLDGVPEAGDPFDALPDERTAKQIALRRQELKKISKSKDIKKLTLSDISKQIKEGEIKELKVVLKGDVQGSVEALKESFQQLSNDEVSVKVIHSATGDINESDVMLASASKAIIVGFHVHPNVKALMLARREHVEILKHSIIYDAIDNLKKLIGGLISPEFKEETTGEIEVREIFKIPKVGLIAGSYVKSGKITRDSNVRVYRDGEEIYKGTILALKRYKDDINEAKEGFECGISIKNYQDIKTGDIIKAFVVKEVARVLS